MSKYDRDPHPIISQLRIIRTDRGRTLADIATATGYSKDSVWRWETADHIPSLDAVTAYAHALGYDLTLTRRGGR